VWVKIRVMAVVAVARPPAGINRELGQVGEPVPNQCGVNSGGSAAHQGAKRIEICRSRSVGRQIRIQKLVMSDLIVSIIVDVLSNVGSNNGGGGGIGWMACPARI